MVLPLGDLTRTRITPVVTYALIAINILVYLVQVQQGDQFTMALRVHALGDHARSGY